MDSLAKSAQLLLGAFGRYPSETQLNLFAFVEFPACFLPMKIENGQIILQMVSGAGLWAALT